MRQTTTSSYFRTGDLAEQKTYAGTAGSGTLLEQHTLGYVKNGVYMNGHAVSDSFLLAKGGGGAGPCTETACVSSSTYDARERLDFWRNGLPGDEALEIDYTLDATTGGIDTLAGDVTREVTVAGTAPSQTTTTRDFTYTPGGQLATLSVDSQLTERYFYGPQTGNLKCVTNADLGGDTNPCALVGGQPKAFVRDWYDFDLLERLDRFVSKRSGAEVDTDYRYDAFDRIASQTEQRGSAITSTFEYLGLSGAVSTETRAGATAAFSYDANGRRVSLTKSGATHTYARNPHGDISLLLNETTNATASYGYRPYGTLDSGLFAEPAAHTETNPLNPYRFNDRRLDTGSGSIDMGARRYSPDVGRYLQQDFYRDALDDLELSTDPLTQNRYSFAGGNPISFVEVDGHRSCRLRVPNAWQRRSVLDLLLGRNKWTCPETLAEPLLGSAAAPVRVLGRWILGLGKSGPPRTRLVPGGGLAAHEALGGHTLARHLNAYGRALSERALRFRLATEPGIRAASTFLSRSIAEEAISGAILANSFKVAQFLRSSKPRLVIHQKFDDIVGHVLPRDGRLVGTNKITVVIDKAPGTRLGYIIRTAYPQLWH